MLVDGLKRHMAPCCSTVKRCAMVGVDSLGAEWIVSHLACSNFKLLSSGPCHLQSLQTILCTCKPTDRLFLKMGRASPILVKSIVFLDSTSPVSPP